MLTTVTAPELAKRLEKTSLYRGSTLPIGLHCWPKAKHEATDPETGRKHPHPCWYGIGPVDWGNENSPPAWFDIRIGDSDYGYMEINRVLAEACELAGLAYINMA